MSKRYHYKKGAMALGPYGLERMKSLAGQGQIGRSHQISDDGGDSWRSGAEYSEIFEALRDDASVAADSVAAPAGSGGSTPAVAVKWHYTSGGDAQPDPVSEGELQTLIRMGKVSGTDRVWTKSLGDSWVTVVQVPMFAALFPSPDVADLASTRGQRGLRRGKSHRESSRPVSDEPRRLNAAGLSGFICSLVAVVLLAIPCLVWVFIAQPFFWIFNLVMPLLVVSIVGLVLSVIGLRKSARGLATAGTILGVVAVTMAAMAMIGSATIRWRLATLHRGAIDSCAADIELAKKRLGESLGAYRGTRQREDEADEVFGLRQKRSLNQMGSDLAKLVNAYDGHVTVTAGTSEFFQAFDGLVTLRKTIQDVQQAARAASDVDLMEVLDSGHADAEKIRLLMDTLALYEKNTITLSQAEAKMAGR
jgi:hypothetical protein